MSHKQDGIRELAWTPPRGYCVVNASALIGPSASNVNSPSSIALNSVFEPQNAKPSCMMASGVIAAMGGIVFGWACWFMAAPLHIRVRASLDKPAEVCMETVLMFHA